MNCKSVSLDDSPSDEQYAYVIDLFNPYHKAANRNIVKKFLIHDKWWAIYKVKLEWGEGRPMSEESEYINFHIYNTPEEVINFIHQLKYFEGTDL